MSRIITTEAVLWEWLNALSNADTRNIAAEGCARSHADVRIEIVPFHAALIGSAVRLYTGRPDKNWSLTDCLSFEVMDERRMTDALTTDRHFEQAGWRAMMLEDPPY